MRFTVSVPLSHSPYDIIIEPGLLENLLANLPMRVQKGKLAILVDATVAKLYRSQLDCLCSDQTALECIAFEANEKNKNSATVEKLYESLFAQQFERQDALLALGGGVAGDIVGFVAATFLRGLPFVQMPSTLLAMVDASVGGKVGYNTAHGKNLIGAFYQPQAVLIDPRLLRTLDDREYRSGLAECIKHSVLDATSDLFLRSERLMPALLGRDEETVSEYIAKNVELKAAVVCADEKEQGQRALLNFGHTFAHAIEAATGYGTWLHGEAVALGMIAATKCALSEGLCESSLLERLERLIEAAKLPLRASLPATSELRNAMATDKKVKGGKLNLVLPRALGAVEVFDSVSEESLLAAWNYIRQ